MLVRDLDTATEASACNRFFKVLMMETRCGPQSTPFWFRTSQHSPELLSSLAAMPSITNVGGSLTSAVALTLIAWAVRFVRARNSRKQDEKELHKHLGRFHASISVAALQLLVQKDPIPHAVIDVREKQVVEQQPLPLQLGKVVAIPVNQVQHALQAAQSWAVHAQNVAPYPGVEHMLVFVSDSEKEMVQAAVHAAKHGFARTATLAGGLQTLDCLDTQKAEQHFINRDAVAGVLGHVDVGCLPQQALVLDIRRHDERALYGSIPGAVHLPVHQLPAAFQMTPEAWEDAFHFPRPSSMEWVIMQCRTNKRATWAAQLAADAGLQHCLIYRQGAYGWRLQPEVKVYSSYEKGDCPPEPESVDIEAVDATAARNELTQLGMLDQ